MPVNSKCRKVFED